MKALATYAALTINLLSVACSGNSPSGTEADDSGALDNGAESQGGAGNGTNQNSDALDNGGASDGTGGQGGAGNGTDQIVYECTPLAPDAAAAPPRVVIVQDLSSSMASQWSDVEAAILSLIDHFRGTIQLGLVPFSSVYLDHATQIIAKYEEGGEAADSWFAKFFEANDDDCGISPSSIIAPTIDNAAKVIAAYESVIGARMVGGTPTYLAMEKTRELLIDKAPGDGSKALAILISDGAPNCSSPTGNAVADTESMIATLSAEGVKTYVVGYLYSSAEVLDGWAAAGNTGSHYESDDTGALGTAIASILSEVVPCE